MTFSFQGIYSDKVENNYFGVTGPTETTQHVKKLLGGIIHNIQKMIPRTEDVLQATDIANFAIWPDSTLGVATIRGNSAY